ncbi:MAG: hypothetical protein CFE35_03070 [Novosphingobium sp. PASSN1]|nr:MAG: hypothetical protein CFE35_03070 [Novosphingobium sp. PASSN1]
MVLDSLHKTLSPATYPCSLCALTYGSLRMDPKWRKWLAALGIPAVFQHKDDTPHKHVPLPAVLCESGGQIEVLIDAPTLDGIATLDALIALMEARLSRRVSG